MPASHKSRLLLFCLALTLVLLTPVEAITLSQFQQINGFSAPCTAAYNTPITGCTSSDFIPIQPSCSSTCISSLMNLQDKIISACAHTAVDPATLIGHFLAATGVVALCPNEAGSSAAPTIQVGSSGRHAVTTVSSTLKVTMRTKSTTYVLITSTPAGSTSLATSSKSHPVSAGASTNPTTTIHSFTLASSVSTTTVNRLQTTSSSVTTTPGISSSVSLTISISALTSKSPPSTSETSSTSSASREPSLASLSTSSTTVEPSFVKTAVNNGRATVFTSKAEQTASNNPDAFGGGGSPFEISSCTENRVDIWTMLSVVSVVIVLWF